MTGIKQKRVPLPWFCKEGNCGKRLCHVVVIVVLPCLICMLVLVAFFSNRKATNAEKPFSSMPPMTQDTNWQANLALRRGENADEDFSQMEEELDFIMEKEALLDSLREDIEWHYEEAQKRVNEATS